MTRHCLGTRCQCLYNLSLDICTEFHIIKYLIICLHINITAQLRQTVSEGETHRRTPHTDIVGHQQLAGLYIALLGGAMQSRLPEVVESVDLGALLQEQLHHIVVALICGQVQGRQEATRACRGLVIKIVSRRNSFALRVARGLVLIAYTTVCLCTSNLTKLIHVCILASHVYSPKLRDGALECAINYSLSLFCRIASR